MSTLADEDLVAFQMEWLLSNEYPPIGTPVVHIYSGKTGVVTNPRVDPFSGTLQNQTYVNVLTIVEVNQLRVEAAILYIKEGLRPTGLPPKEETS